MPYYYTTPYSVSQYIIQYFLHFYNIFIIKPQNKEDRSRGPLWVLLLLLYPQTVSATVNPPKFFELDGVHVLALVVRRALGSRHLSNRGVAQGPQFLVLLIANVDELAQHNINRNHVRDTSPVALEVHSSGHIQPCHGLSR